MNTLVDILSAAEARSIALRVQDGQLVVRAPKGAMTDDLLAALKKHKPRLIAFLQNTAQHADVEPIRPLSSSESAAAPLSSGQRRLWLLERLSPDTARYNTHVGLRLRGPLDRAALKRCIDELIARHAVLRTRFPERDGEPYVSIDESVAVPWTHIDLRHSDDNDQSQALERAWYEHGHAPYDLDRGPLFRLMLVMLADDDHLLAIGQHHIITDGTSVILLLFELLRRYRDHHDGTTLDLPPLPVQYTDFAHWQTRQLTPERTTTLAAWWRKTLADVPPLDLPMATPAPTQRTERGALVRFHWPPSLLEQAKQLATREHTTLFIVLLSAYAALLHRYSGQDDFAIGTVSAGRERPEVRDVLGFFVKTLALRCDFSDQPTFVQLMDRMARVVADVFDHQELPFDQVVRAAGAARGDGLNPLVRTHFVLESMPIPDIDIPGVTCTPRLDTPSGAVEGTAKFDLGVVLAESDAGLTGVLEYSLDVLDNAAVERLAGHYRILMEHAVREPDTRVIDLALLSASERKQLLVTWNDNALDYGDDVCIHTLIEAAAEAYPEAVAVVAETDGDHGPIVKKLDYRGLDQRANQLAHALRERGVVPDTLIALYIDRSLEMLVAILGVLKAGGAFVPLDIDAPHARVHALLADIAAPVVLSVSALADRLADTLDDTLDDVEVIRLDSGWSSIAQKPDTRLDTPQLKPHHLAYVLYTSGSTGRPKGVMLEHRQLVNYVRGVIKRLDLPVNASYAHISTFAADLGNTMLFPGLCVGGCLHVISSARQLDHVALGAYFDQHGIDCLKIVPTHLSALLTGPHPERVLPRRRLVLGGEASSPELIAQVRSLAPDCRVFNHYGPTEATIGMLTYELTSPEGHESTVIPLGRPIPNMRTYVVDAHMTLVPVGVPGELLIGGAGVTRGYLHRESMTADRFITNPFPGSLDNRSGVTDRVYRTGDRVRYQSDGTLVFLGRVDHQVKIRGFRIEPGEIASVLGEYPDVRDALVTTHELTPGDKRLVAYVVPQSPGADLADKLRSFLQTRLPEYMIPSAFMSLSSMPLTDNGKINRRALPAPVWGSDANEHAGSATRTPTQQILADIWADVLHIPRPGIHANFFDLGGHSLIATQVMARVRQHLNVEVPLRALFEAPTIATLAERVEHARQGDQTRVPPLEPRTQQTDIPLSFSQQRVWFLEELDPDSGFYGIPMAVSLDGQLDIDALSRAMIEIVRRHEVLRTTFPTFDGHPRQVIGEPDTARFPFDVHAVTVSDDDARKVEIHRRMTSEYKRTFDLANGPLLRASLLVFGERDHVLLITIHHIVYDGWSLGVLMDELSTLYDAFVNGQPSPLPPLDIQYADFSLWQRDWLTGEVLASQMRYWKRQLQGAPEALELPTDRPRPPVESHRGAALPVLIPAPLTADLVALSRRSGVTLFMTLLATFKVLLHRYSGQDDIVVGSPIANRVQEKTEKLVGFFLNNLVLRTNLSGTPTFRDVLERVREVTLEAYAHQHLPFEKLVVEMAHTRDTSRSPLFQTMFVLQNTPLGEIALPGLSMRVLEPVRTTSKYDLSLALRETADGLDGNLEYSTDLFERTTMERMLRHWLHLLRTVVANPDHSIADIDLLDDTERRTLIVDWNQTDVQRPPLDSADTCVHRLFEAQVARTPDAIAVQFEDRTLTYAQLYARANQLATHLRSMGVGPDTPVGICVHRSLELPIGLFGILQAGGAYVPLDPEYPAERLAFMIADSGAHLVLTHQRLADALPTDRTLAIDDDRLFADDAAAAPLSPTDVGVTGAHLAYIIYTSGSTGTPKGVLVTHGGVHNYLHWRLETFGLRADDRVLHKTSISFDSSVWEIFEPLAVGACTIIAQPGIQRDPRALLQTIVDERITATDFVPSLLRVVLEEPEAASCCHTLRRVTTGGEALSKDLLTRFMQASDTAVYNGYGPTETSVASTFWTCDPAYPFGVPIGRPVANTQLYVLDDRRRPVPIGIPGELYIAGMGVARGYLDRPDVTAARFLPDPFSERTDARMYRTGDRVRYLADGNLQFLGRVDRQVKIRGFRIELGEVERAIAALPGISDAVVTVTDSRSGKQLVAYYVNSARSQDTDTARSPGDIRATLKQTLPDYMVPSVWMPLLRLPLTPSGKLDRKKLPAPIIRTDDAHDYVPPSTPLEQLLVEIWQQTLEVDRIGVTQSFFDLGGHSLLLPKLQRLMEQRMEKTLKLVDLFRYSTIRAIAQAIEPKAEDSGESRRPAPENRARLRRRRARKRRTRGRES